MLEIEDTKEVIQGDLTVVDRQTRVTDVTLLAYLKLLLTWGRSGLGVRSVGQ